MVNSYCGSSSQSVSSAEECNCPRLLYLMRKQTVYPKTILIQLYSSSPRTPVVTRSKSHSNWRPFKLNSFNLNNSDRHWQNMSKRHSNCQPFIIIMIISHDANLAMPGHRPLASRSFLGLRLFQTACLLSVNMCCSRLLQVLVHTQALSWWQKPWTANTVIFALCIGC